MTDLWMLTSGWTRVPDVPDACLDSEVRDESASATTTTPTVLVRLESAPPGRTAADGTVLARSGQSKRPDGTLILQNRVKAAWIWSWERRVGLQRGQSKPRDRGRRTPNA